jgi:hypothetical protein
MDTPKIDLEKLVKEAIGELDVLIKKETDKAEELKKAEAAELAKKEESSKEKSKEESSKEKEESMKKDDASASAPAPSPEASDSSATPPASPEASDSQQDQDFGSLEELLADLDPEKLQDLMEKCKMEMAKRSSPSPEAAPADMGSASPAAPAPSPSASAPLQMSEKDNAKVEELEQKLAKSETETKKLQAGLEKVTELFEKMINKPVRKAVTDINHVAKPGEGSLQKSEDKKPLTDKEIHAKLTSISRKPTLTKNERDSIVDFYLHKKGKETILKLIEKES